MLKGTPIGKTSVDCETAQKVNKEISEGIHPESESLEAAVIAHTLLCAKCQKVLFEQEDAKN
ncbi:hypothetical protein K0B04_01150 [Patescibacteria group bacterium]|nr:hypothetical protein [Patescibacteria group bacterium]